MFVLCPCANIPRQRLLVGVGAIWFVFPRYKIKVMRRTFPEVYQEARLGPNRELFMLVRHSVNSAKGGRALCVLCSMAVFREVNRKV